MKCDCTGLNSVPWNSHPSRTSACGLTWYWVFAHAVKLKWGPAAMPRPQIEWLVSTKWRETWTDTQRPCEHKGRDQSMRHTPREVEDHRPPPEARTDAGEGFSLSLQRKQGPPDTPMLTSHLQNYDRGNFHCFKQPGLWQIITSTLRNEYNDCSHNFKIKCVNILSIWSKVKKVKLHISFPSNDNKGKHL